MKLNFNIKSGTQYCMTARLARHSVRELCAWDDGWTSLSCRTVDFGILSFLQEGLRRRMTKTPWIRLACHQDSRQPWKVISVSRDRWLPRLPHFGGFDWGGKDLGIALNKSPVSLSAPDVLEGFRGWMLSQVWQLYEAATNQRHRVGPASSLCVC